MASNIRNSLMDQLIQLSEAISQTVLSQLQRQIIDVIERVVKQLESLLACIGRFDLNFDMNSIEEELKPVLCEFIDQALASVLLILEELAGGKTSFDLTEIFNTLQTGITPSVVDVGQRILSPGFNAVLGSQGGSRALNDLLNNLQTQISSAITVAQVALIGALNNVVHLGSNCLHT